MQAREAWAKHSEHTKTLSEVARNLMLSGVVAVWACRTLGDPSGKLTATLIWCLLLFGASILLDVAHYSAQAFLFRSKARAAEVEAEKDEANHEALCAGTIEVNFRDSDFRYARGAFYAKIAAAILGWLVLMWFLASKLTA